MNELVHYDAMCRELDAAYELDEVKEIRDRVVALQAYMRIAHNVEAERRLREIRYRAERKWGQLRVEQGDAQGRRTDLLVKTEEDADAAQTFRVVVENIPTLAQLGVTRDQAAQWQRLGRVSDADFEKALATGTLQQLVRPALRAVPFPAAAGADDEEAVVFLRWLVDFDKQGWLDKDINEIAETADAYQWGEIDEHVPKIAAWLMRWESNFAIRSKR
jgi:hypothetical protein